MLTGPDGPCLDALIGLDGDVPDQARPYRDAMWHRDLRGTLESNAVARQGLQSRGWGQDGQDADDDGPLDPKGTDYEYEYAWGIRMGSS